MMLDFRACHCQNVDFGTYANQVSMKTPFGLKHREDRWVCIDTCITTEIGYLWHQGVVTWNSCCGHKKTRATVIVRPESNDIMDALGYEWVEAMSGCRAYLLRTGTQDEQVGTDQLHWSKK